MGDLAHKSEIMVHLDGQVAFAGAQTEMKNILSIIAEFYLSNNSTKWRKQSLLVPPFDRLEGSEASAKIHGSLKPETVNVVPLKRKPDLDHHQKGRQIVKQAKKRCYTERTTFIHVRVSCP